VAVGQSGTIIRSSNGTNWSKRLSNTSRNLNDIAYGGGLWVAVGESGTVVTSSDASFFTLQNANTEVNLRSITFGNNLFVAVGDTGAILRSTNGVNWTIYGTDEALNLRSVAFDSGTFVATGAIGIVHQSRNAVRWTTTNIAGGEVLSQVAGAGGHFVAITASPSSANYISTNGLNWQPQTFLKPLYGADSSEGELYVAGEYGYIAKAVFAVGINVSASVQSSGLLNLSFTASMPGVYEVISTDSLAQQWTNTFSLGQKSGAVIFEDPRPIAGSRFYRVRRVP
jgi:hypothetical protein